MLRIWLTAFILTLLLIVPQAALAQVPQPARYGGTVTVDGTQLTQATDTGYTFAILRDNGLPYTPPSTDIDGLNATDWYLMDVPIFDINHQPGGAHVGETAEIRVYRNGLQLKVTNPNNGLFTVGSSGSMTQMNLEVQDVVVTGTSTTTTIAQVAMGSTMGTWGWRAVAAGLFLLLGVHFLLRARVGRDHS